MKFNKIALLALLFASGSSQAWELKDFFTKECISSVVSISCLSAYYLHINSQLALAKTKYGAKKVNYDNKKKREEISKQFGYLTQKKQLLGGVAVKSSLKIEKGSDKVKKTVSFDYETELKSNEGIAVVNKKIIQQLIASNISKISKDRRLC